MSGRNSRPDRRPQLAYSEIETATHDEHKRRTKALKIKAVLQHFLGRTDFAGLRVLDIGCSTGFTAAELNSAGATVVGVDIDVPALASARARFGDRVRFVRADGAALPLPADSVDLVVYNHIYEHVVEPEAVVAEIRRVLRTDGVAYFAFGNRFAVMEPHYGLPFLSWLPARVADRYLRLVRGNPTYHERFRSRGQLVRMCDGLRLWDYTYTVLSNSDHFFASDMVPTRFANAPSRLWHLLAPVMPTFVWIGTAGAGQPMGPALRDAPTRISGARDG